MKSGYLKRSRTLAWSTAGGLLLIAASASAGTNLLVNGTFSASGVGCVPAFTVIPGWTVVAGNVDIGANYCTPAVSMPKGINYFLDLTGSYASGASDVATISQTATTVVGTKYKLTFEFGGNPQWQGNTGLPNDSALKAMAVFVNGAIAGVYSVNTAGVAATDGQWKLETLTFTATSTSTTVSFQSLNGSDANPSDFGPLLTNVILEKN